MSVRTLLTKEIESELVTLEDMDLGSDECKIAIDGVTKLIGTLNEMDKLEFEYQERFESRKTEKELKMIEMEDERNDRIAKNVITVVTFAGGVALTVWGTYKTFKFEETGTVTSIIGRGFINKLFPKK